MWFNSPSTSQQMRSTRVHMAMCCDNDFCRLGWHCIIKCCGQSPGPAIENSQITLHWRHNEHDGVLNHQPHGCLLNRLFRRRSKKTSKLRLTGLCVGNSPHKGPVTRKMLPFDDVIVHVVIINPHQSKLPQWVPHVVILNNDDFYVTPYWKYRQLKENTLQCAAMFCGVLSLFIVYASNG